MVPSFPLELSFWKLWELCQKFHFPFLPLLTKRSSILGESIIANFLVFVCFQKLLEYQISCCTFNEIFGWLLFCLGQTTLQFNMIEHFPETFVERQQCISMSMISDFLAHLALIKKASLCTLDYRKIADLMRPKKFLLVEH